MSLLLVPKCLSLPFLLFYFTLLPPYLDKVKVPYFFLCEELLLSALAIPPSAFQELALGSSEITHDLLT